MRLRIISDIDGRSDQPSSDGPTKSCGRFITLITTLTINLFHYTVTLVAVCQLLLNKRIMVWYGVWTAENFQDGSTKPTVDIKELARFQQVLIIIKERFLRV